MIEVKKLDHNGRGIGKIDNKIVFIENALPGELVEINIIKEKKNYIEANVSKYIKKSDKRVNNKCSFYDKCGGCDLLHMSYEDTLLFKTDKIKNIFEKYYKNIIINKIIESDLKLNYRNKVTFQVNNNIGFFKKESNSLICISNCLLADNIINNSIKYLQKLDLKNINKIICKTNSKDLMIIIDSKNEIDITPIKEIANSIYINNKLVYGNKYITQNIGNYKFNVSPTAFFQINPSITKKLYDLIKNNIEENEIVLDLYCGTGTIGIYCNKNNKMLGIELNQESINDANINKNINNINSIEYLCGKTEDLIKNINYKVDTIIVDPPREGLIKNTVENIIKINPNKIIYVSCDPMTLIRDLNDLNNYYTITSITPLDMFPYTKHVETLVILKKN